jgi:hypothetical protein
MHSHCLSDRLILLLYTLAIDNNLGLQTTTPAKRCLEDFRSGFVTLLAGSIACDRGWVTGSMLLVHSSLWDMLAHDGFCLDKALRSARSVQRWAPFAKKFATYLIATRAIFYWSVA